MENYNPSIIEKKWEIFFEKQKVFKNKNIINDFLSDNDPLHDFLNSDKLDISKDNKDYKISIILFAHISLLIKVKPP